MTVTVKSLAKAAGVSRGTVDRVLHDRGSVKKELAIKIKALAKEMGYVPNRGGKILQQCVKDTRLEFCFQVSVMHSLKV